MFDMPEMNGMPGPGGPMGGPGGPMGGPGGPDGGPGGPMGGPPKAGYTEKKVESTWILEESCSFPKGIVLYPGELPVAAGKKAVLMTVDGVPTTIAPGVYAGKVELIVYDLAHVDESEAAMSCGDFRCALMIQDGQVVKTGLEHLAGDYTVTENGVENAALKTNIDDFNGIIVCGKNDEPVVLKNLTYDGVGGGNSEGRGSGVMAVGDAKVKIDGAKFWNHGTQTAIMASGRSRIDVENSVIYGTRDFTAGKLCPWVLGINGANRLTNAIDEAKVTYKNSIVVAQSWAALSTDGGRGVTLDAENVFSGIGRLEPYCEEHAADYAAAPELNGEKYGFIMGNSAIGECGYVNYADTGFHNSFKDSQLYSPDYIFILSTFDASIAVEGGECYSDRIGVMWHKNKGGTVSLKGGKFYAKDCLFLNKSWSTTDSDGCFCHMVADGTELSVGEGGVIYQMMSSDDVGLGFDSVYEVPEIEADLSRAEKLPETSPAQKTVPDGPFRSFPVFLVDGQEVVVREDVGAFLAANPEAEKVMYDASNRIEPSDVVLKNLTVAGDIFNGVYQRIQVLEAKLENATLTGKISSAYTRHADEKGNPAAPGTTYRKSGREDEHLGIGRVVNTPAPVINNPVELTLTCGSVWNPVGESYLAKLTLDETSTVNGTITVDGAVVTAPGVYEGSIVVTE